MKLKAYFWKDHKDSDNGYAVIAESVKEAKKLGYEYCDWKEHETFLDQRCIRNKNSDVNIKGLSKGVIDDKRGMVHGLYTYMEEELCDICGQTKTLVQVTKDNKCICSDCEEKYNE